MAIQISEKHLSPKARQALENAKSKSQFLRDAIEYYVSREIPEGNSDPELKADIKEIKELLFKMSLQPAITESAIAKESFSTSHNKDQVKENPIPADDKKEIVKNHTQEPIPKEVEKPDIVIQEPVKKQEPVEPKEPVTSNTSNDGLSEEEKQEIAKMLESSLDFF